MSQAVAANNLSSATYLLNLLIRLWLNLSNEEFAVLETTISPVVSDSAEQVMLLRFY